MIEKARRAAARAGQSADASKRDRKGDILGRGMAERAAMSAEGIRSEAYGKGESPVTAATFGGLPPMSVDTLKQMQAADVMGQMQGMNSAQKDMLAEALANRQMPGPKELIMRGGRAVMGAMADEGTKGDIARVGAVSGGVGAITASGAALIDLMSYLTQGQQVDAEREDILRS